VDWEEIGRFKECHQARKGRKKGCAEGSENRSTGCCSKIGTHPQEKTFSDSTFSLLIKVQEIVETTDEERLDGVMWD
jgi:hypothetical protein